MPDADRPPLSLSIRMGQGQSSRGMHDIGATEELQDENARRYGQWVSLMAKLRW